MLTHYHPESFGRETLPQNGFFWFGNLRRQPWPWTYTTNRQLRVVRGFYHPLRSGVA